MMVAVFAERRLWRRFLWNNIVELQLKNKKKGEFVQIPWQAETGSLHKCTGRCLCLLHAFLLPSSFCNNNKKTNKEEKPNIFKLATSKNRKGCRRADAMRPLEAGGSLHPLPSGTCKDTWSSAASLSWDDSGNEFFGSRNRNQSPPRSRREGGSHMVSDHPVSFLYTLWLLIW